MQNKKLLKYGGGLVILIVVFLLGVSVGNEYQTPGIASDTQSQSQTSARLMVDYGNGQVKTFEDLAGATVFDVLKEASKEKRMDLRYKEYGDEMGVFIESIDGIGNDPTGKKWWQYWVNNTYGQMGVSSYNVQSGDVIEFKFIEGQE